MRGVGVGRPVGLFLGACAIGAALLAASTDNAEAGRRRHHRRVATFAPPSASMLVDVKTGRVLQASNPDAPRIPASITKVMTLYMLFEQLERGRFSLDSELRVSAYAASQAPTKLGLQPGETISVDDAIKGMVTKSANDVSVVVAESISGSEEAFAEAMTRKARSLGMSRSAFYNPHGLPNDPPNITTARDLVTLGRAIQDRFPKYYHYFATRSFDFNGTRINGHNRLLGRLEGVDGIKTGYTRASGFNLLTSAKLDGRHVVGVVLGGRSGRSRDAQMASMITAGLDRAYAGARMTPPIGEGTAIAAASEPVKLALADAGAPQIPSPVRAEAPRAPVRALADSEPGDTRAAPTTTASIMPPKPVGRQLDATSARPVVASAASAPLPVMSKPHPVRTAALAPIPGAVEAAPRSAAAYAPVGAANDATRPPANIRHAAAAQPTRATPALTPPATSATPLATTAVAKQTGPSGWVIQLGATDDLAKANAMLANAKAKSKSALAKASPFTEKISKDGATLWRARFAGFDADAAQAACKTLKRDGFACFASRV